MSPASAETFAQNVRKVCICTKGDVTSHALKATLLPTAPWSAAVLVSNNELSMHLLLHIGLGDQTNPSGMLCWCLMGNASGSLVPSPWLGRAWMGTAIFMQIAFGVFRAHGVVGKGVPENLGTAGEMHTLLWLHWESGGRAPRGAAERNERYLSCYLAAQCEMSEWGPWGPCSKKRKLCGFKKGNEDRTRRILQAPSGDVSLCPATTEVRRCTVQKSQCPEGERGALPNFPQHLFMCQCSA